MSNSSFSSLGLIEPILRALDARGYSHPTPIQEQAIPLLLEGRDLLGIAQTGTGKTAAFALPILQQLAATDQRAKPHAPHALVLAPTRELAIQIHDDFRAYGAGLGLRQTVILGGVGQSPQVAALRRRVDILVATPGRLLDLLEQGHLSLDHVSHFVLDEADRMLDMGFIHDVRRVIKQLPRRRHSLFFSATMPREVSRLAADILVEPVRVEVTPAATTVEKVKQQVYFVRTADKRPLLAELLSDPGLSRVLVFSRTKHRANRIAEYLDKGGVDAAAIHGNKSQNARQKALEQFRSGTVRVLVATDIAARGIDVDGVSHVINYELPNEPESYVHRIGRTARAGAGGAALAFCDHSELEYLHDIEKLIRMPLDHVADHPYHVDMGGERSNGQQPAAAGPPRRARQHGPSSGPGRYQDRRGQGGGRPARKPAGAPGRGQSQAAGAAQGEPRQPAERTAAGDGQSGQGTPNRGGRRRRRYRGNSHRAA